MYTSAHKAFSQLGLKVGEWILGNEDGVAGSEDITNHHHDRTSGFRGSSGFGIFVRMPIKSVSVIGGQVRSVYTCTFRLTRVSLNWGGSRLRALSFKLAWGLKATSSHGS